ncbi:MAG: hypothetical protein HQ559_17370 [Lentisphaerae bacterium]|nr:hypothetical protein [Lentisphaerota bacterium]
MFAPSTCRKRSHVFAAVLVCLILLSCGAVPVSAAASSPPFEGGVEAWSPHNGQSRALLVGPRIRVNLSRHLWLRTTYLSGEFRQEADVEYMRDAEAVLGISLRHLFLGAGFRHHRVDTKLNPGWQWAWMWEELERNADIYGPVMLAGTGGSIGGSAFSWGLSGLWLIGDHGPLAQVGYDPAYGEAEAGMSWDSAHVSVYAGYRLRRYRLIPPRNLKENWFDRSTVQGAVARVSVTF